MGRVKSDRLSPNTKNVNPMHVKSRSNEKNPSIVRSRTSGKKPVLQRDLTGTVDSKCAPSKAKMVDLSHAMPNGKKADSK
jgi:hypothetical protein